MSFFEVTPGTHWTEMARALFVMYWLMPGGAFALIAVMALMGRDHRPRWWTIAAAAVLTFALGPPVVFGGIFGLLILGQWGWYVPVGTLVLAASAWGLAAHHRGLFA